jgi:hypothetical protein
MALRASSRKRFTLTPGGRAEKIGKGAEVRLGAIGVVTDARPPLPSCPLTASVPKR